MKVIPLSCRCKLSVLVPQVRRYLLVPPARTTSSPLPAGQECIMRPMNLPPAA